MRLIVRRVKPTPGSQLALFATCSYHGFITDRDGETLELEADHCRHAEIENAIRDLKYGVGLNHLPSSLRHASFAGICHPVRPQISAWRRATPDSGTPGFVILWLGPRMDSIYGEWWISIASQATPLPPVDSLPPTHPDPCHRSASGEFPR